MPRLCHGHSGPWRGVDTNRPPQVGEDPTFDQVSYAALVYTVPIAAGLELSL